MSTKKNKKNSSQQLAITFDPEEPPAAEQPAKKASVQMDPLAKASLASTVAPAGRAAFLAGFTYYEMGRYIFYGTGSEQDWSVHYVRALCGAFAMAVLSVSISSIYGRYLLTLQLPKAQRGFALGARNWYERSDKAKRPHV